MPNALRACELCKKTTHILSSFYLQFVCDSCNKKMRNIAAGKHADKREELVFYARSLVYHIRKMEPQEDVFRFLNVIPLQDLNNFAALLTHAARLTI